MSSLLDYHTPHLPLPSRGLRKGYGVCWSAFTTAFPVCWFFDVEGPFFRVGGSPRLAVWLCALLLAYPVVLSLDPAASATLACARCPRLLASGDCQALCPDFA